VRRRLRTLPRADRLRAAVPALVAGFVLLALTAGFAKFPAPLGWIAWAPRLMLPWLPAVGFLLVRAYAPELDRILQGAGSPVFWAAALVIALASLPQFVVLFRPGLLDAIFRPDSTCPTEAVVQHDPVYYYRCIDHLLWTKRSTLISAYSPRQDAGALGLGAVCCALLLGLIGLARRRPRELNA